MLAGFPGTTVTPVEMPPMRGEHRAHARRRQAPDDEWGHLADKRRARAASGFRPEGICARRVVARRRPLQTRALRQLRNGAGNRFPALPRSGDGK